jgi:CRISPR-associated endoribonuclease Cas6
MRLLIELLSTNRSAYESQYHYHLQSFIYSLVRNSTYHYLHDKEGYKFFCYSNIFPIRKTIRQNDSSTLIISSPDSQFISVLFDAIRNWNSETAVGQMRSI